MSIDEVMKRVADIEASRGDNEGAHGMEDDLHVDVLKAISEMDDEDLINYARDLAYEALKTLNIDFTRWCA